MTQYKTLTFNHANLKKPIYLVLGTIAGFHHSETTQSTHIYTTGGIFPVVETPEQVISLFNELNSPVGQGDNNGNK